MKFPRNLWILKRASKLTAFSASTFVFIIFIIKVEAITYRNERVLKLDFNHCKMMKISFSQMYFLFKKVKREFKVWDWTNCIFQKLNYLLDSYCELTANLLYDNFKTANFSFNTHEDYYSIQVNNKPCGLSVTMESCVLSRRSKLFGSR